MVVPEQLAGVVAAAKGLLNNGNPWLDQAALAEMMRGRLVRGAPVAQRAPTTRRAATICIAALRRNFGDISVSGEAARPASRLVSAAGRSECARSSKGLARRARIGVYSFTSGGAYVARASTLTQRGLILGYAALSRKQIEQGIARLSDAIDDALDDPSADVNALFGRAERAAAARCRRPRSEGRAIWTPAFSGNRL